MQDIHIDVHGCYDDAGNAAVAPLRPVLRFLIRPSRRWKPPVPMTSWA